MVIVMNKLEVGMWVRYKYENCIYIGKIKFISEVMGFDETLAFAIDNCMEEILKKDIIGEPSFNIIDVVQVGDYVNGYKVIHKNKTTLYIDDYIEEESYLYINQEDIKSIVTKESMESVTYYVK